MNDPNVRGEHVQSLRWVCVALLLPALLIVLVRYTPIMPIQAYSLQEWIMQVVLLVASTVMIVVGLNGCKRLSTSFRFGRILAVCFLIVALLLLLPILKEHFPQMRFLKQPSLLKLMVLPFYALFACALAHSILSPCAYYSRDNGRPNVVSVQCNFVLLLIIVFTVLCTVGDVMQILHINTIAFIDNLAWRTLFNRSLVYGFLLLWASFSIFLAQSRMAANQEGQGAHHNNALGYF